MLIRSSLLMVSLLSVAACASPQATSHDASSAKPTKAAPAEETVEASAAGFSAEAEPREVGDYVVFGFEGSFRDEALTLVQRVADRDGHTLTIEALLVGDATEKQIRYQIDDDAAGASLLAVETSDGAGTFSPAEADAYEAFFGQVVHAADANLEDLGAERVDLAIGSEDLACERSEYRVSVGDEEGTLVRWVSAGFAWGDVRGEILGAQGDVIYRAALLDLGTDASTSLADLAASAAR